MKVKISLYCFITSLIVSCSSPSKEPQNGTTTATIPQNNSDLKNASSAGAPQAPLRLDEWAGGMKGPVPGQTLTANSLDLARTTKAFIVKMIYDSARDCRTASIKDTQVIEPPMIKQPDGTLSASKGIEGATWAEKWIVDRCGTVIAFYAKFGPVRGKPDLLRITPYHNLLE